MFLLHYHPILQPNRTYYLFDPERHAKDWCDAIDWAREKYFGKPNASADTSNELKDGTCRDKHKRAKSPAANEERRSRPGSAAGARGLIGRAKAGKTAVKS